MVNITGFRVGGGVEPLPPERQRVFGLWDEAGANVGPDPGPRLTTVSRKSFEHDAICEGNVVKD